MLNGFEMDIEIKKNEKGEEILEIISGYALGTQLNLSELIYYLGDSIAWNGISKDLTGLAMRYSINLLRLPMECEEMQKEALEDLLNVELLVTAFSRSINSAKITKSDLLKAKIAYGEELERIKSEMNQQMSLKDVKIEGLTDKIKSLNLRISDKDEHIKELNDRIASLKTGSKDENEKC